MSGAHTRSRRATESNLLLIHGALGSASQLAGLKQTLDAAHTGNRILAVSLGGTNGVAIAKTALARMP